MTDDAAVELDRVVDRLRTLPLTRLAAPWDSYPSLAAGARALAQALTDRCVKLSGVHHCVVPDVGDAAVGDQVAVTGRDLLALPAGAQDRAWMAERLREFRLSV
jgi:hypothetical protein